MARAKDEDGKAAQADAVPRTRGGERALRADEWTPAKCEMFFSVLAETANVSAACRQAGMTKSGAYMRRGFDPEFRKGWRVALAAGYARLEMEMLERALIGEERVRGALETVEDDAAALELLARYPQRVCDLLFRTHRAEALAADATIDAAEADALVTRDIEDRLAILRARLVKQPRRAPRRKA